MFRHIVVGADGSAEGHDAVALAALIAAATGGDVTPLPRSTARALRAHAAELGADLIVIGSDRAAPAGHCAIGPAGRYLLDRMPAALAIATRGLAEQDPHLSVIGIGYDGGLESQRALQLADELATAAGAELRIETIYEEPAALLVHGRQAAPGVAEDLREIERRGAVAIAERTVARMAPRSRLSVCVGEPGHELRTASAGVDLLVIGSRRQDHFARVTLGGAGEALASGCACPLIIARRSPRPSLIRPSLIRPR